MACQYRQNIVITSWHDTTLTTQAHLTSSHNQPHDITFHITAQYIKIGLRTTETQLPTNMPPPDGTALSKILVWASHCFKHHFLRSFWNCSLHILFTDLQPSNCLLHRQICSAQSSCGRAKILVISLGCAKNRWQAVASATWSYCFWGCATSLGWRGCWTLLEDNKFEFCTSSFDTVVQPCGVRKS